MGLSQDEAIGDSDILPVLPIIETNHGDVVAYQVDGGHDPCRQMLIEQELRH